MRLELTRARDILAGIWIGLGLLVFAVAYAQIVVFDLYSADQTALLWEWLLPAVLPTVTVMLGVLGTDLVHKPERAAPVRLPVFTAVAVLTVAYLLAVGVAIIVGALRYSLEPLRAAEEPLLYFQGVVNAGVGVFFAAGASPKAVPGETGTTNP